MKALKKIIEYGLYLSAFLLPWQTRWIIRPGMINGGYSEYGTISLYGADILAIVLLLLFLFLKFKIPNPPSAGSVRAKFQIPAIWWAIGGLELFVFVSIFFAPDKILALYRYGVFLLGVGLFWLVVSAAYDKIKLIYSLLLGLFIQAGLGIWQFLSQSSFADKWLGLAMHDPADLGASVVETLSGERWLRAYGGLEHPNILGGVLAIGVLLAIFLILKLSRKDELTPRLRSGQAMTPSTPLGTSNDSLDSARDKQFSKKSEYKKTKLYTLYFILCTLFFALFFTFSRGAWFGCLAGILILLIMWWQKNLIVQKKLLAIILSLALLGGALFYQYNDLVLTRLSQDTRLEQKSSQERISSYQESWQLIERHPFFGVGIGNYSLAISREIKPDQPSFYYQPVHNTFLLVLSEIGIIGVLCFIFFIINLIIPKLEIGNCLSRAKLRGKLEILSKSFEQIKNNELNIVLIVSMIIMMLVDHWFWSLHFGVLFFWLLAGIMIKKDEQRSESAES